MSKLKNGLTRYFTEDQLNKISTARVFIAGCGGLGSNVAHLLVRSGFLHFTLLDCDFVDESNLNRQFFFPDQTGMTKTEALAQNLLRLEPDLDLNLLFMRYVPAPEHPADEQSPDRGLESLTEIITTDQNSVGPDDNADILQGHDVFVEAFDSPESKALFVASALKTGRPVISASGIAGYGDTDTLTVSHPFSDLYLVGDGRTGIDSSPPLAPRVNVAAAKQADLVLTLTLDGDIL